MKVFNKCVVGSLVVTGSMLMMSAAAHAATVLDDPFDSFTLGTTWQPLGTGAPDIVAGFAIIGPDNVLRMGSTAGAPVYQGVETIAPISLVGVVSMTVDVRLRPLNQGVPGSVQSAMVAVLGASGAFSSAGATGPATVEGPSWADLYLDSEGSANAASADFNHPAVDGWRRMILTIDGAGTSLSVLNADDSANAFSVSNPNLTLADYGAEVDIALRHLKTSAVATFGDYDFVTVTTVVPEPSGGILTGAALLGLAAWRRRK